MDKQIFWIASYPKSGNTLLRAILTSLFFTENGLFNFNLLKNIPIIESTINLDFIKKININDYNNLHKLEILSKYWAKIQSKENLGLRSDFLFVKTHHALSKVFDKPFTSESSTRGIIYIVRDPRDVVISYSHHFNTSLDKSINKLSNIKSALDWEDNHKKFFNKRKPLSILSSWDLNCESWMENSFSCPFLMIKYEDMISNKLEIIKKIIDFFVKNFNFQFNNLDLKIKNIIKTTSFEFLKNEEDNAGFSEAVGRKFFRTGKANQWETVLNRKQIMEIEKNFYLLMKKLDYKRIYYKA